MALVNPGITGLVSWWPFDETSGNAQDSHGTNHLTPYGGTIASATGKVGNARDLESSSSQYFMKALNSSLQFNGDVTVGMWFKPESIGTAQVLLDFSGTGGYRLRIGTTGTLQFSVDDGSTLTSVYWGTDLTTGSWYYILGWHDDVNNKIYIQVNNGTPVSVAFTGTMAVPTGNLYLGQSGDAAAYTDGIIDETFIARRVYTDDERSWFWNGGAGRRYTDLITPQGVTGVFLSDYGVI